MGEVNHSIVACPPDSPIGHKDRTERGQFSESIGIFRTLLIGRCAECPEGQQTWNDSCIAKRQTLYVFRNATKLLISRNLERQFQLTGPWLR